ncbi:MAG TPA: calcium-binding protein, partial [Parvularculaceae bacterium]|nr:calcium-binding protein [Parvularculaceae bacterium]
GHAGADILDGGSSVDKAEYTTAPTGVHVNLQTGGISGDAAGDTYVSIEIVSGSNYNDTLTGSRYNDDLRGRGGSDLLDGAGADDKLYGYSGNDTLIGGAGNDTLTGGGHNDRFIFSGDFGHDVIQDMNAGAFIRDVIEINGFGPAFDSFAEILAAATQVGADTVITINGNTITLIGVDKNNLDPNDFTFG